MPTVAIYTLGCKVNSYESKVITDCFEREGYTEVPFSEVADIYIVNTCSVTAVSDSKSRQVLRAARRKNPSAVVAAVGCYAQVSAKVLYDMEEVDLVLGSINKTLLPSVIEQYQKTGELPEITSLTAPVSFEPMKAISFDRTRATMKIQDGCNNFCAYCIIPYARGRIRSKLPSEALDEFTGLAELGYKEIILTGIEIASYGMGEGEDFSLTELIEDIAPVAKKHGVMVRLGSLEPRIVTKEFIEALNKAEFICPHFHLSLQSGCDKTLAAMNRKYDTELYRNAAKLLRDNIKGAQITTDIIVGFPGESDCDFEESLAFAKEMRFLKVHVFPYSIREGTRAATMEGQVAKSDKGERAFIMSEATNNIRAEILKEQIGSVVTVLLEDQKEGGIRGYTPSYIPVLVDGGNSGQVVTVLIDGVQGDMLTGKTI